MYISELGRRTNATPKAIRLYESLGLLGEVGRKGTYRIYSEQNVYQVQLIRQVQALGFRLADMGPLLLSGEGAPDWGRLVALLEARRVALRVEVARLHQLDSKLGEVCAEIRVCLDGPVPPMLADCIDKPLDSAPRDKLHTS
ncbi:MerR family transcriptional regulator [Massilia violaceinigra]|uniref:MerR family transcriptional regulator n=1 Tax=Massilia violaceinigra TaxID=2045208 RepID=A0A2D2DNW3_9BURK|nr:MerR family transcriptional regulator [Massilia violaceinigra]ATQ76678.1 MerR family transcriptional regulator [Massilia violaceinigra]